MNDDTQHISCNQNHEFNYNINKHKPIKAEDTPTHYKQGRFRNEHTRKLLDKFPVTQSFVICSRKTTKQAVTLKYTVGCFTLNFIRL